MLGASASDALGVFMRNSESADTAPVLVCHFGCGNSSKPPELLDRTDRGVKLGVGVSSRPCSSTVAKESGSLPIFLPYCNFMRESICWGPRRGRRSGSLLIVEADLDADDLDVDSSSHPGVAGMAYRPSLKGGASPSSLNDGGLSSHVGAAYRPWLVGGTSWLPLGAVALVCCPAEAGIVLLRLEDIADGRSRNVIRC